MSSSMPGERDPGNVQDVADEMVRYGITRVPVDYFYYKEFRYTNLEDALAQAKREQP